MKLKKPTSDADVEPIEATVERRMCECAVPPLTRELRGARTGEAGGGSKNCEGWETLGGEAGGAVGSRLRDADGLSDGGRVPGMWRLAV